MSDHPIVIVGGGIGALFCGLLLRHRGVRAPIVILEQQEAPGGLLRALEDPVYGPFDQGMHTFTSTGVPELDGLFASILPEEEWIRLQDGPRDISGLFFEGKLQHGCHYPDLRSLPRQDFLECAADFFLNLKPSASGPAPSNMRDYGGQRFGRLVTEKVISPILERLYGRPAELIDPVVAKLLPLDRIGLYDEAVFRDLLPVELFRQRIAYPEQRNLPLQHASGHFSLYPKKFGAFRLVEALCRRLERENVSILTRAKIRTMECRGGKVVRLVLDRNGEETALEPVRVIWTAGVLPLAHQLGLPSGGSRFETPRRFTVLNLLLDRRPDVGDLYYFWSFDRNSSAFRVTNFFNYCPAAVRQGGWPVSLEFFLDEDQPGDRAALTERAVAELKKFGIWGKGTRILCTAGHDLPVGFPILSLHNRAVLEAAREEIAGAGLENLAMTGIQSEWGVVFQPDVMKHCWKTIGEMSL
jgi:protoporphyrinogen oxidase